MFETSSLEDIDDVWRRYMSLQSVLAELFLDLYEDETPIEELQELAEISGFRHFARLLIEVGLNSDHYGKWRDSFPATCS
ncbi:MAG: hypothetical protein NTY98_00645 [Verrucomicrobia bacterium]|nr:hypothetical protein [Verrucomicrobiota bacterium]